MLVVFMCSSCFGGSQAVICGVPALWEDAHFSFLITLDHTHWWITLERTIGLIFHAVCGGAIPVYIYQKGFWGKSCILSSVFNWLFFMEWSWTGRLRRTWRVPQGWIIMGCICVNQVHLGQAWYSYYSHW